MKRTYEAMVGATASFPLGHKNDEGGGLSSDEDLEEFLSVAQELAIIQEQSQCAMRSASKAEGLFPLAALTLNTVGVQTGSNGSSGGSISESQASAIHHDGVDDTAASAMQLKAVEDMPGGPASVTSKPHAGNLFPLLKHELHSKAGNEAVAEQEEVVSRMGKESLSNQTMEGGGLTVGNCFLDLSGGSMDVNTSGSMDVNVSNKGSLLENPYGEEKVLDVASSGGSSFASFSAGKDLSHSRPASAWSSASSDNGHNLPSSATPCHSIAGVEIMKPVVDTSPGHLTPMSVPPVPIIIDTPIVVDGCLASKPAAPGEPQLDVKAADAVQELDWRAKAAQLEEQLAERRKTEEQLQRRIFELETRVAMMGGTLHTLLKLQDPLDRSLVFIVPSLTQISDILLDRLEAFMQWLENTWPLSWLVPIMEAVFRFAGLLH